MLPSLVAAAGALTVLTLVPGPDMAVVTRHAVARGRAAAVRAAAGVVCGLLVWGVFAAAGLTALLAASAVAYAAVTYAGAAYLIYLGVRALIAARRHHVRDASSAAGHTAARGRLGGPFTTGVLPTC